MLVYRQLPNGRQKRTAVEETLALLRALEEVARAGCPLHTEHCQIIQEKLESMEDHARQIVEGTFIFRYYSASFANADYSAQCTSDWFGHAMKNLLPALTLLAERGRGCLRNPAKRELRAIFRLQLLAMCHCEGSILQTFLNRLEKREEYTTMMYSIKLLPG